MQITDELKQVINHTARHTATGTISIKTGRMVIGRHLAATIGQYYTQQHRTIPVLLLPVMLLLNTDRTELSLIDATTTHTEYDGLSAAITVLNHIAVKSDDAMLAFHLVTDTADALARGILKHKTIAQI